jgi:hypothetical protein
MAETIKETYNKIETIANNILNNHIGSKFDQFMIENIKRNIIYQIKNHYPDINLILNIDFNQYSCKLNVSLNATSKYFDMMDMVKFKSHDFFVADEVYYNHQLMKCSKCNLYITEGGNPVDGDFSCEEWLIKQIIE